MKKLITLAILSISASIQAQSTSQGLADMYLRNEKFCEEFTAQAKPGCHWTMEWKNKIKKPVKIYITFDGHSRKGLEHEIDSSKGTKESQHGYYRLSAIDPALGFTVTILAGDQQAVYHVVPNKNREIELFTIETDSKGNLLMRPQEGKLGGFSTESQSGLSTEYNVKKSEIQKVG